MGWKRVGKKGGEVCSRSRSSYQVSWHFFYLIFEVLSFLHLEITWQSHHQLKEAAGISSQH